MRFIKHGVVEVGTEPTLIYAAGQGTTQVKLRNLSDAVVFIGNENVGVEGELVGWPIDPEGTETLSVFESDVTNVYAVTAEGTADVMYLITT